MEEAQGESLLSRVFLAEPGFGDLLELGKQGWDRSPS
jgi:hypothetical protein